MNMKDGLELMQLREEVAKLRERIAVLEARQVNPLPYPWPTTTPNPPWRSPFEVTCGGPNTAMTQN